MSAPRLRLGVNVDHIATVRNARGGALPDPVRGALLAIEAGADGITAHLREDRRHIRDADVELIRTQLATRMNLESAVTEEMIEFACRIRPQDACLVPERRRLYANLTVKENLMMGAYTRRDRAAVP